MRSRQQLEDCIQRLVCDLLPKMNKQDIRPAYQQQDNAGKDILNENSEHAYRGFTPNDNFIYITVSIGTNTVLTSVDRQGNVQTGFEVVSNFCFYGNQSSQLSLCLFNLLDIPYALDYLESHKLYTLKKDEEIAEMHEIINEQWYERHEFSVRFILPECIRSPKMPELSNEESLSVQVIVSSS